MVKLQGNVWGSTALIAMGFGPYAPEEITLFVLGFSHNFKRF